MHKTKSQLLNSTRLINNTEKNKVKGDKVELYKSMNEFADLAKEPQNLNDFEFDTWLSFLDVEPNFLKEYNNNRIKFLKACSKLVENNVQFLKENNSLSNLATKMKDIKMLISSLHDFIVNHGTFRELLRKKIPEQNPQYWDDYYNCEHNNSKNVATRLKNLCDKAKYNGTFKEKLKACFTLIISLSLAYEFKIINAKTV